MGRTASTRERVTARHVAASKDVVGVELPMPSHSVRELVHASEFAGAEPANQQPLMRYPDVADG